jgi:F-type H+-transporting ATPase subunit gamma
MATIRELRRRIKSVSSTKKITKAQELIATSRISKARAQVAASKPYSDEMTKTLSALASASGSLDHPLLTERVQPRRAAVLVVTSDRGMCGGYNSNVLKRAEELYQLLREEGKEPVIYVIGKKGATYYAFRDRDVAASWTGFSERPSFKDASAACKHLVDSFMAGSQGRVELPGTSGGGPQVDGVDELHIVYTKFVSMLTQSPEVRRMAPLDVTVKHENYELGADMLTDSAEAKVTAQYEFEPGAEALLSALLPKYLNTRIYASLLEAAASESAARRTAMKAATDNASSIAELLTRQANQARQAQITQEISEIVGGANALAEST